MCRTQRETWQDTIEIQLRGPLWTNDGIRLLSQDLRLNPWGMTFCVMLSRRTHPRPLFPSFGAPNALIYKLIGGLPRCGCETGMALKLL